MLTLYKTIPDITLIINIIGIFGLGLVQLFPAVTSGFFSGFTTFSTFIMETLLTKIIYISLAIILGIVGFMLGIIL